MTCVEVPGCTKSFGASVPGLNPAFPGSKDVLGLPDACGNHFVHLKVMCGPVLFQQTY
jgi:hypothetical protein